MSKPYATNGVLIGQGASLDPKAITPGTTGQVLTGATSGPPAFAAPAAVDLAAGVTGILPVANGGTGQAVGAIAIMQFIGAAVLSAATSYLGRDDSATEADIRFVCPVTGTVVACGASVTAAPGGTDTFTYRVMIAGSAAAGNTVITGAAVTQFTALSNAVTAGDTISVRVIASALAAVTNHAVTLAIRVTA